MIPELEQVLPEEARGEAAQIFRPFSVNRGSYLFYPEDEARALYYVREGWVRLFQLGQREEEITLTVLSPGEIFGEAALIPGEKYGLFAEAMSDVELITAPREDLLRLMTRFPEAHRALLILLARRLKRAEERLRDLRFKEVLPRLAKALLMAMRPGSEGYEVSLSHQDLAHLAGSTRETVTKVLGELAMQEIIELGYRRILILNPEELKRVVG